MSRGVIVLQAAESVPDLGLLLATHHWRAQRAARLEQVRTLLQGDCHVGIAVFDDALDCSPQDLAELVERSSMEWIAVLPRDHARDRLAERALASSYFDFHTLPVDEARLLYSVGHAYGKAALRHSALPTPLPAHGRNGMVGESPAMLAVHAQLERVMRANAPLLLTGESGVGKELAARAVHLGSSRSKGPFVPVNCGALPQALIESLLFGHEKGAFTGAHERQIGSIEAAHCGTIFLDEIGDLPRSAQASLLRFLQESTVVRLGSTREMRIDARGIAATNMDLKQAVRAGRFREDLFYRLNVLNVEIPPLRERGDDSVLLAEYFFRHTASGCAPGVHGFSRNALAAIRQYSWPGNVRELLNRVQHAMVMCDGPLISAADLQLGMRPSARSSDSLAHARAGTERGLIEAALERTGNNIAAAARELSISRVTLYRLLKRLGITPRGPPPLSTRPEIEK